MAAGTAVTVKLVSSQSSGGAASPEEAVQDMVGSLEQNDLLGVVDVLAPWERDFARQGIDNYLDDAKDNGLLAKDTDLSDVGGYTLTVDGLKVSSEPVNERIANVSLVGGTAHLQSHFDQLPLGAKLLEQLNKANDGKGPDDVSGTTDLADAQLPPITTIKQDGRWYVSLFYSIAESARRDAGRAGADHRGRHPGQGGRQPAGRRRRADRRPRAGRRRAAHRADPARRDGRPARLRAAVPQGRRRRAATAPSRSPTATTAWWT